MSEWTRATWQKGKKTLTGSWYYNWSAKTFVIRLDSVDRVTGEPRTIRLKGEESPEWDGWKLVVPPVLATTGT